MNDDEALDKVRARMVEWQAYVALPRMATSWVDVTGVERNPESVRADCPGARANSTVITSIICAKHETRPEDSPGILSLDHPLPNRDHPLLSHSWSDHPGLHIGGASGIRSGAVPSLRTAVADPSPDGLDNRLIGLQESLQHEREQSRRLTEVVAREQLLQAYALRAATDPRNTARATPTSTPGPAYWQRRERIRRDWCMVIAWILLLLAGIVVMVAMNYSA